MLVREQTTAGWPTRRAQRCLIFAFIFALILIFGICKGQGWPRSIELHLDSLTEAYSYGSSPEAGMPSLPFKDNSIRKSTEQPFFDFSDYEENEQPTEVAPPQEPAVEILPREANGQSEWGLVGLH